MSELVSKEYLSKQFTGYSVVVKEQLNKKIDIQQDVADANKLLGIGADGVVTPIEAPSSVKVSAESDNQIEQKTDGIYVKDMSAKISAEQDNALIEKQDGLYVPSVSETKVSEAEDNTIEVKDDGIYVAPTDLDDYSTTDEVKELIKDELYVDNVIPAHYEIADSTTPNALEVVADGTATDGQIDLSNVADIGASIGDFVLFVDEVATTDTKYAEKTSVYSKSETDEKIAEAVTGGTVSLDGYVQKTELETTLEDYTTDDELSTALADYTKTTDADEKYVLDSDMEIIDLATLESMLGLSTEELEGLASLILDSEIRIDKTFSSSKIYSDLQQVLSDSKSFTLSEIAKASTASYKVVDSTVNVTDSKYIYLIANSSNNYDMYILDDVNGATRIGETTIDLSGYLTTETASQTYVLQTVFDVLSGNIGDVTTLQTSDKTLVGAVNELKIAIDNATVEISSETNNLLEEKEDGLFVGSETVTISKADYDLLSDEKKNNGQTYFVYDDNTTEDGTDLTQFAKVSDLEEINSKIEETNNNLSFDGLQPLKEILVVTSGSGSVVLDNDSWIQFNLHGDGTNSNVIGFINNIVIFGFQHISCDTYNSVYAHKGDIVKISVVGNAYGKAYIQ